MNNIPMYLVRFLSAPFMVAGFIWQFMAGSFYAGRLISTAWITQVAQKAIGKRRAAAEAEIDRSLSEVLEKLRAESAKFDEQQEGQAKKSAHKPH